MALEEHGFRQDEVTDEEVSKCDVMSRSAVEVVLLELSFTTETIKYL